MILLDTSVIVWALDGSSRLGRRARKLMGSGLPVHVSAVSLSELVIKAMLGKIELPANLIASVQSEGYTELPLTGADTTALMELPDLIRHDPFDRLLVAQAQRNGMTFLTADRALLGLGRDFIVDATV